MTPTELERLLAERPVSAAEYSRQPGNWSNLDLGEVRDHIMAAHRADAPALVRALEAMLAAIMPMKSGTLDAAAWNQWQEMGRTKTRAASLAARRGT